MISFPLVPNAPLRGWRLDRQSHAGTWDSGLGAHALGGRWNLQGVHAVYASLDPATAILEVAVHKGFKVLDSVAHALSMFEIHDQSDLFIVSPESVPNPNWLVPGTPSLGQQAFGRDLLTQYPFIAIPSAVSRHSWNIIFTPSMAQGKYTLVHQERFALDTRLNAPH